MNEFNLLDCDKEFCFICKGLIINSVGDDFHLYEVVGSIFSHILVNENIFINKICAACQGKVKSFDEFQSKANQIKDELVNLYESSEKFEELDIDFNFKPIELEVIDESANVTDEIEDLSDDFRKIIEEKGIKYDFEVFQRVFGGEEKPKEPEIQKQRKKYFCDECQIEIKTFNNFLIHKAEHEKRNCQQNIENLTKSDEKYNCFCGKIFLYKLSYTQHLKIHNNIREYNCRYEFCDFKAFNSTHLQRHIRARHTKEKNHTCIYCGRKFAEKYNMNSHIRKQHMSDASHKVDFGVC